MNDRLIEATLTIPLLPLASNQLVEVASSNDLLDRILKLDAFFSVMTMIMVVHEDLFEFLQAGGSCMF